MSGKTGQRADIPNLAKEFLKTYDAVQADEVWKQHQQAFRSFWHNRVLATESAPLQDDESDQIIRILDRSGKGNRKGCEAVAKVMVSQGAWRRMFGEFRANPKLANLLTNLRNPR